MQASINNLFIFERTPTFWLILIEKHASKSLLQKSVEEYRTEFTDPVKFLLEPYEQKDYEKFLLKINEKQNREFIENYKNLPDERAGNNVKIKQKKKLANRTQVSDLLKFKMLMDNEIALAVPGPHGSNTLYDLYGIYKATRESKPKILDEGYFHLNDKNQYSLKINNSKKNRTFDGVLLKSGVMASFFFVI